MDRRSRVDSSLSSAIGSHSSISRRSLMVQGRSDRVVVLLALQGLHLADHDVSAPLASPSAVTVT